MLVVVASARKAVRIFYSLGACFTGACPVDGAPPAGAVPAVAKSYTFRCGIIRCLTPAWPAKACCSLSATSFISPMRAVPNYGDGHVFRAQFSIEGMAGEEKKST